MKAQGLSLNVIIIAALALVVMVVVLLIFRGQAGSINDDLSGCFGKGGLCIDKNSYTSTPDFNKKCQQDLGTDLCEKKTGKDFHCCVTLG